MLDLGFVPGTPVELDQQAPFGDLRAYRIRGSVFALRAAESWSVKVRPAEPGDEAR
ncbi:MAG TPA: FeoA family protein [Chloroflexota bacterium]|nr:FeoA family protein [Chloroflexota bacterium]